MTLLYPTLLILSILYYLFLNWCWLGWLRLKRPAASDVHINTFVSIIIPVRNEEMNIEHCLEDLVRQNYPATLFEIIVVNDNSTDNTAEVVSTFIKNHQRLFSIRLIASSESSGKMFKKEAISKAINIANGNLIITTDGDCRRNEKWLKSIVSYYEQHSPDMICGSVAFDCTRNWFQQMQSLEFCGLIGIAGGSIGMNKPLMCNGANLAFNREIFQKVHGYSSAKNIATGDDTLLMKKIAIESPCNVHFIKSKESIVYTKPSQSLYEFFNQRKRWASKIPINMGAFTIGIAIIAWLLHLGLMIALLLSLMSIIPWTCFLVPFGIKVSGEFILLSNTTGFFKKSRQLWLLLPAEVFYVFYITVVGAVAPFSNYVWKGRTV